MTKHDPEYEKAADAVAGRIRETVPANLATLFRETGGFDQDAFHSCAQVRCGEVCAVDGSNGLLLESGSMAVALFRAAQSTFHDLERSRRSLSPLRFAMIGPGAHPLLPAVRGLAEFFGIRAPWWIRIDPGILDHAQFAQWQHGQMFVACLHPRARSPLKVELPKDLPESRVQGIMDRLAACSGDGRVPGYPYPLLDAHRTVVLTEEILEQARSDLMRRIAATGIGRQTYEVLFGDYHDEFTRY